MSSRKSANSPKPKSSASVTPAAAVVKPAPATTPSTAGKTADISIADTSITSATIGTNGDPAWHINQDGSAAITDASAVGTVVNAHGVPQWRVDRAENGDFTVVHLDSGAATAIPPGFHAPFVLDSEGSIQLSLVPVEPEGDSLPPAEDDANTTGPRRLLGEALKIAIADELGIEVSQVLSVNSYPDHDMAVLHGETQVIKHKIEGGLYEG